MGGPLSRRALGSCCLIETGRELGGRLTDLEDSVLFIEIEPGAESFHVGWWLSVYDAARAKELATPARQTFRRIQDTLPAA